MRMRCEYPQLSQTSVSGLGISEREIMLRLQRVESAVENLRSNAGAAFNGDRTSTTRVAPRSSRPGDNSLENGTLEGVGEKIAADGSGREIGRLVFEKGESRYVSEGFWASLDLEETQETSPADQFDGEIVSTGSSETPSYNSKTRDDGFVFGFSSLLLNLHALHPSSDRIFLLWQLYLENVDPLIKLIHTPSVQRLILQASRQLADVPPAVEALMFAIYYAAVVSMQGDEQCKREFGEEQTFLLARYRFGVEQALAKANFLKSQDLNVLQAFVLYLICARRDNNGPDVWTMTGLVVRVATKLGIHRDGGAFSLLPYDIEMRRRLWWQICILDIRTAEDNGTDPSIYEHTFNTKLPLDVNDSDLDRGMINSPREGASRTEMLFSLQRFEISYAIRKIVFSDKFNQDNGYAIMTTAQKGDFLQKLQRNIEERYIRHCDMRVPLCFVTVTAARLILSKLKLIIHHTARKRGEQGLQAIEKTLFTTSIEILEYTHALRTNDNYQRWAWLFQTYVEWDALAYLLLSLIRGPNGEEMARAWKAVKTAFDDWKCDPHLESQEHRWQRIKELRARALAAHSRTTIWGQGSTDRTSPLELASQVSSSVNQEPGFSEHLNFSVENNRLQTRARPMGVRNGDTAQSQSQVLLRERPSNFQEGSQSQLRDVPALSACSSDAVNSHPHINANVEHNLVPCQTSGSNDPSLIADTGGWNFDMLANEIHEDFSWDMELDRGFSLCL